MSDRFLRGDWALVSPRVAWLLERRFGISAWRQEVRGRDAEVDAELLALHAAAVEFEAAARASVPGSGLPGGTVASRGVGLPVRFHGASGCGNSVAEMAGPGDTRGRDLVSARGAAALTGLTSRAVRAAAASGRLPGIRADGRWLFLAPDVVAWAAGRRAA